jgi:hypothetical protein
MDLFDRIVYGMTVACGGSAIPRNEWESPGLGTEDRKVSEPAEPELS